MGHHHHNCQCGHHHEDHHCECGCGCDDACGCGCDDQIASFDGFEEVVGTDDGNWIVEVLESDGERLIEDGMGEDCLPLLMNLAFSAFEGDVAEIKHALFGHMDDIIAGLDVPVVQRMVCIACKVAVHFGDGVCANFIGSMHYNGKGTPQNYALAFDWYALASRFGCSQGTVNLGYCYYYGRGCHVDYAQAYKCFAQAATLDQHPEAYMKLGDMHERGYYVYQDRRMAYEYYKKAYELSKEDPAMNARPQHHLADCHFEGIEGAVEADAFVALQMYQKAEICYYFAIKEGMTYYEDNLRKVIAAQTMCRSLIEEQR